MNYLASENCVSDDAAIICVSLLAISDFLAAHDNVSVRDIEIMKVRAR